MKKYKIEFYSKLLDKRITKVVEDDPKNYEKAIILEVINEPEQFDLSKELLKLNSQIVNVYRAMIGGAK